jgi:hypothetical protein
MIGIIAFASRVPDDGVAVRREIELDGVADVGNAMHREFAAGTVHG